LSFFVSHASNQRVAMDNIGNAIVLWTQGAGGFSQVFLAEYRDGSWQLPAGSSDSISPSGSSAGPPEVAMNDLEEAVVVWAQNSQGTAQPRLFKSEYRGGKWSYPAGLNDFFSPDDLNLLGVNAPQVTLSSLGEALVTWGQYGYYGPLLAQRYYLSEYRQGKWQHPADANDVFLPGFADAEIGGLEMDDVGNAIITWRLFDGVLRRLFKSEYRLGSWQHPSTPTDFFSPDGFDVLSPGWIAMNNDGDALILWNQQIQPPGPSQLFLSTYR
jgi:hypothetical protein